MKQINKVLIDLAKDDFLTFCQLMPGDAPYEVSKVHEVLGERLEEIYNKIQRGEKVRLILSIPPRFGKSWTASSLFPAWALGKDPSLKFILATYGAELSEKNGMKTRDLVSSPQYRSIFPDIKLRPDLKSKRKWMIQQKVGKRWKNAGEFTGVGMGGSVTGIGGHCIILDDPHKDRKEAESKLIRDRVYEYFKSTLYNRLEGAGAIIIIMQRWHTDDLVGRLLEEQENGTSTDVWDVINFPALPEEDVYIGDELFIKKGESLWPEKFPVEVLENIRDNVGLYSWYSQFQQNPIIQKDGSFNEDMFKKYEPEELIGKSLDFYTMVDPAVSLDKSADEAVITTIAKEKGGPNIYRIKETAGHMTPKKLIETIFKHYEEFKPKKVILESIALQKTFKYALQEEQRRRGVYFKIHGVKKQNKQERIEGLIPLYEAGVIKHLKSDSKYEEQLLQFPRGRRDDRIDAMSFCLDYLKPTNMNSGNNVRIPKIIGYYENV
jgi:predicted phage terminase large subunit-like protein